MNYPSAHHGPCFESRESFLELLDELRMAENNYPSAVVTWEGLFKIQDDILKSDFRELREFDLEVIFYVREQAEHIQKGLLQRFKKDPEALNSLRTFRKNRDFFAFAEKWTGYAGKLAKVVHFERTSFPNNDIVEDFLGRIGIEDYSDLKWGHTKINESLFIESVKILEMAHVESDSNNAKRRDMLDAILAAQNFFKGNSYFLTKAQVDEIRGKYKESNANLKAKYKVDLSKINSSCWAPESAFQTVNEELLAKFNEIQSMPLLESNRKSNSISKYLLLGWKEYDGQWWSEQNSIVRFRLKLQRQSRLIASISIKLNGKYSEHIEPETNVKLADKQLGCYNLESAAIYIPIRDLPDDGVIKLELLHKKGAACQENGEMSFSLNQIDVSILSVDGTEHQYAK